jgi:hypothetical protein
MSQIIHLIAHESSADSKEFSLLNGNNQTGTNISRLRYNTCLVPTLHCASHNYVVVGFSLNVKSEREAQGAR